MNESSKDIQIELLNAQIEKLEADVRSERSEQRAYKEAYTNVLEDCKRKDITIETLCKAINRLLEDRKEKA